MTEHESPTETVRDLQPWVLYRLSEQQAECAMWRFASGELSLAMFREEASARRYESSLPQADAWQVYQPPEGALRAILRHCLQCGVRLAVLEPNQRGALRIFDLAAVIAAIDAADSPPVDT